MGTVINPLSIDWAVLCHLDHQARASYAEIGRAVRLSKENVRNAVLRLEQKKIVSDYFAVLNVTKLGLTPYVVYAQLLTSSATEQENLIRKLCLRTKIYWVSRMGGRFDLLFGVLAPSVQSFSETLNEIQKEAEGRLGRIAVNTRLQTIQFPRTYLSRRAPSRNSTKIKKPLAFGLSSQSVTLSEKEKRLLNAIAKNARVSSVELARQLDLPRTTIQRLLGSLEQREIISGYGANVHAEILGYQIYRLLINTRRKDVSIAHALHRFARDHDNIVYIDFGVGEWDVEFTCEVKSQHDLQAIFSQLQTNFANEISSIELLSVFEDNVKFQFQV